MTNDEMARPISPRIIRARDILCRQVVFLLVHQFRKCGRTRTDDVSGANLKNLQQRLDPQTGVWARKFRPILQFEQE